MMGQSEYMRGLDDVVISPKWACQRTANDHRTNCIAGIGWSHKLCCAGKHGWHGIWNCGAEHQVSTGTIAELYRATKAIHKLKGDDTNIFHVVFICNCEGMCCPLSLRANTIKRELRSSLAAEGLSLQEGFEDDGYMKIICELISLPATYLPIVSVVVSKGLIEIAHSARMVDDMHLRINTGVTKDSLARRELRPYIGCLVLLKLWNAWGNRRGWILAIGCLAVRLGIALWYFSNEVPGHVNIEGILPKRHYLPCVSMAGRALLAGYHRYIE